MSLTNFCKQVLYDNIQNDNMNPIVFAPKPYTNEILDSSLNFLDEDVLVENVEGLEDDFGELN